jgi:hypothetical protein
MSHFNHNLENVLRIHRIRLAMHEVQADFPLLRLNKSVLAYQIIATFETLPVAQRVETARAFVSGSAGTEIELRLRQAFQKRKSTRTVAELEAMSLEPTTLDIDEDHYRELQGADLLNAVIRQVEGQLTKTEIRKCFLARFRAACRSEILPSRRGGEFYEIVESVGRWNSVAYLSFGEDLNQFNCSFRLKHDQLQESLRISLGGLLGLGDLRWNDISRETLPEDAHKAVGLWVAMRSFLFEIMKETDGFVPPSF